MTIPGLMQESPLTILSIFERMRTIYADGQVISPERRLTYAELGERVLKLCTALRDMGVQPGDRVGSFAFNSTRHLELYYAVPLLGAVLHTINVRLFPEQIAYVTNHAEDKVIIVDERFAREIFAGRDPIGQRVNLGSPAEPDVREIIGVAGNDQQPTTDTEDLHQDTWWSRLAARGGRADRRRVAGERAPPVRHPPGAAGRAHHPGRLAPPVSVVATCGEVMARTRAP